MYSVLKDFDTNTTIIQNVADFWNLSLFIESTPFFSV